jgi:hypothetical protein
MWGRGIREIYRSDGNVNKAHYIAAMTRVKYTKDITAVRFVEGHFAS